MISKFRTASYCLISALLIFCVVLPVRSTLDVVYAADEISPPPSVEPFTGNFTTSYPIPIPPPVEGPVPGVSLNYNSGRIWGSTNNTDGQAGQQGLGWELELGTITLFTFEHWVADQWYLSTNDSLFISLNGIRSKLVKVSDNSYRLESDPDWKVEQLTSSEEGHPDTTSKTYWLVTMPDGTKYRFGGEMEPTSENPTNSRDQNSVAYVPLGGPGEPIFPNPRAYKWYLDRIEDVHGNVINYYYGQEINYFEAPGPTNAYYKYVRATHLRSIEYTKRADQIVQAYARIRFNMELRCSDTSPVHCPPGPSLPDAPFNLVCAPDPNPDYVCNQTLPNFWSELRLDSIQTQLYDEAESTWQTVALYDLSYSFPPPSGTGSDVKLWLESIERRPGGNYNRLAFSQIEGESYDGATGTTVGETSGTLWDVGSGQHVVSTSATDHLVYRNVDFGSGSNKAFIEIRNAGGGVQFELRLDSTTGTKIGEWSASDASGWRTEQVVVTNASGVHDLYIVFKRANVYLHWLRFFPTTPLPTGLPAVEYTYTMFQGGVTEDNNLPVLSTVETEQGEAFNITYGQSHPCTADFTTVRPPFDCFRDIWGEQHRTWKVTKLTKNEPLNVNANETYTYTYSTPTWNYMKDDLFHIDSTCWTNQSICAKRNWNNFRGHALVTETNAQGQKTEYRYYQGMNGDRLNTSGGIYSANINLSDGSARVDSNWLRGRLAEIRQFNANNDVLARTVYWYTDTVTAGSGDTAARIVTLEAEERTVYCPCRVYIPRIKQS